MSCEVVINQFILWIFSLSPHRFLRDLKSPSYHELNPYMFFLPTYAWIQYHPILIIVVLESILISVCANIHNISVL